MSFYADSVALEPAKRTLNISGHVRVDEAPFFLTSDAMLLRRTPYGVLVSGHGRLAFCACLGTPLAIRFDSATIAPPDDLIVHGAVLDVFGVPLAWAPSWWLRSPGRVGFLMPDVAWRGSDGLRLGSGVHVPWRRGDRTQGLDLRVSEYILGGVLVSASMRTTNAESTIEWDRFRSDDGLTVGSRGTTRAIWGSDAPMVAWDVDAMRGARAVRSTSDLDAASRPFDRADATVAWGTGSSIWMTGVRAVALRGGSLGSMGASGPFAAIRSGGALGTMGTYSATIEAGAVATSPRETTTFAQADADTLLAAGLGPVETTLSLHAVGGLADEGSATVLDGSAQARIMAGLPFGREFSSPDLNDPWLHVTEPRLESAVLATDPGGPFQSPPDRGLSGPSGGAWVMAATWHNALSRWGARRSVGLDISTGLVGDAHRASPETRGHFSAEDRWIGGEGDFARTAGASGLGGAFIGRLRAGPASGFHLTVHGAERDGVDPVAARTLVDPVLEPAGGFLSATGWTGGARAAMPLGTFFTIRGGVDADLTHQTLMATSGVLEFHDPCRCLVTRLAAAHRLGREGDDVWLTVGVCR